MGIKGFACSIALMGLISSFPAHAGMPVKPTTPWFTLPTASLKTSAPITTICAKA